MNETFYKNLRKAIDQGIEGKNTGLSTGFERLDKYISLKKKMMISVIGASGSGKSSFTNYAFLLNPLKFALANNKKVKIILFSMERSIIFTHAKFLIAEIFRNNGVLIDMPILLGWYKDKKITSEQLQYVEQYEEFFNFLEESIDIYEGQRSANDIFRIVKEYSEANGKDENVFEFKKEYIANDPDEQVIIIVDHIGLTKTTKEYPNKKQAIDRLVEHLMYFRDHLNYTVVPVAQLNRDLSSALYKKLESFEPHIDNIKESGNLGEASDCVLSLFEPIRYKTNDANYGDVSKFRCPTTGNKYFRNISILKNSYGIDGVSIGTVFMGQTGLFTELPKAKYIRESWNEQDYQYIFNNSYFLNNKK